jgi:hypothetical protein
MKASTVRDAANPIDGIDDLGGLVFGMAIWLLIIIAAPLIVLVLAAMLFSVELVLLIALALLLVAARLAGVIPWTIGVVDQQVGTQRYEKSRSLVRAIRLVRDINGGRRVPVRWSWL